MTKTFRFIGMALMAVLIGASLAACSSDDDDFSSKYPFVGKTYYKTTSWGSGGWRFLITFDTDTTFNFRTENLNGSQGEGNETPEIGKFTVGDDGYEIKDIAMPSYRSGFRNYRITLYGDGTFDSDYKTVKIPGYILFNSGNSKHNYITYTLLED